MKFESAISPQFEQQRLKLVDVKNITKKFGGLVAVNNVSMGVNRGEVFGLLGDNGAGKSTLIEVISGVYHPEAGQIFFEGKEVKIDNPSCEPHCRGREGKEVSKSIGGT